MKWIRPLKTVVFFLIIAILPVLAGCGSGSLLADGGIVGTGTIIGTVPGTLIEAYGEHGEYFSTNSENNNTAEHPFLLQLPSGVGFYLVMIINENTADEVVMPIAFRGSQGDLLARIVLHEGEEIDLGHVPLFMNCSEVPSANDTDANCILDSPFVLDEDQGSFNPLKQIDADDDGIDDYDDEDYGYGALNVNNYHDPQDLDDDRVPNYYDHDYSPGSNDEDEDGIDDEEDKNPGNTPENSRLGWNGKGMHALGQVWLEEHGEYAEENHDRCINCHSDENSGSPDATQVRCDDCHAAPDFDDD